MSTRNPPRNLKEADMRFVHPAAVVLFAASIAGLPDTRAEDVCPWELLGWKAFSENDVFAGGGDHDYTQGLVVQWWYAGPSLEQQNLSPFAKTIAKLCVAGEEPCTADIGFSYGQTFYTPENIVDPAPQPDDHPWGGYLFGSGILSVSTAKRQHTFEAQVGVLGPAAQAEWVQTEFHQLINDPDKPAGWDNQIRNEPAVQLLYTYRRRWGGEHIDSILQLGGGAGTVQDFASAGLMIRSGWGLRGFGKTSIVPKRVTERMAKSAEALKGVAPASPECGASGVESRLPSGPHFFGSLLARLIPFNTFLRGGTFHHIDTNITPNNFSWDASAGFSTPISKLGRWSVAFELVSRSPEFAGDGSHRFGSIVLSYVSRNVIPKRPRTAK